MFFLRLHHIFPKTHQSLRSAHWRRWHTRTYPPSECKSYELRLCRWKEIYSLFFWFCKTLLPPNRLRNLWALKIIETKRKKILRHRKRKLRRKMELLVEFNDTNVWHRHRQSILHYKRPKSFDHRIRLLGAIVFAARRASLVSAATTAFTAYVCKRISARCDRLILPTPIPVSYTHLTLPTILRV